MSKIKICEHCYELDPVECMRSSADNGYDRHGACSRVCHYEKYTLFDWGFMSIAGIALAGVIIIITLLIG